MASCQEQINRKSFL